MKRTVLVALVVMAAFAIPAAAQDFASPKPQFISFTLGVPVGYSLYDDGTDDGAFVAGRNFGVSFAIIDDLTVGYDYIGLGTGYTTTTDFDFHLLRLAYSFTDRFGAALSFGNLANAGALNGPAVGLGVYGDLFQKRSQYGITYGLRLKVDYLAQTSAFDEGTILFNIGASFGL